MVDELQASIGLLFRDKGKVAGNDGLLTIVFIGERKVIGAALNGNIFACRDRFLCDDANQCALDEVVEITNDHAAFIANGVLDRRQQNGIGGILIGNDTGDVMLFMIVLGGSCVLWPMSQPMRQTYRELR